MSTKTRKLSGAYVPARLNVGPPLVRRRDLCLLCFQFQVSCALSQGLKAHQANEGAIGNFAIIICGFRQYVIGPTNHRHRWSHQS
jgi:hypothetical protein